MYNEIAWIPLATASAVCAWLLVPMSKTTTWCGENGEICMQKTTGRTTFQDDKCWLYIEKRNPLFIYKGNFYAVGQISKNIGQMKC